MAVGVGVLVVVWVELGVAVTVAVFVVVGVGLFVSVFVGVRVEVIVKVDVGDEVTVGVGVQKKAGTPVRSLIRFCPFGEPHPVARSYPLTAL